MSQATTWSWSLLLIGILGFLVVYPLVMLMIGALTDINPVNEKLDASRFSLQHFVATLGNSNVHAALLNSVMACAGGAILAVIIGLSFSWIVVRTNTPGRRVIAAISYIPLFVPPMVAAIAWSLLGSPTTGLLNTILKQFSIEARINIYSMPGLIAVFGMYYAPYVYMFTASALRNMDPTLEEASEISGASAFQTQIYVTFPLIGPAIVSSMLLSFVVMLGIYGIPAVLGSQSKIMLLTTYIFQLTSWSPPLYNAAAAVSMLMIVVAAVLILLQQKILAGRSYVTISGKGFRPRSLDLGRWRWLTFTLAVSYLVVVVAFPMIALAIAATRKYMFVPNLASLLDLRQYSFSHFDAVFSNLQAMQSIWNTVYIGIATAVLGGILSFAIGYTVQSSKAPGRRTIDLITTLPAAIPGLIIGVAYLWAWIGLPVGLYGSMWILVFAFIGRFIPDTVKVLSTSLSQIHPELKEAAWIAGKGPLRTIATIVLPLAKPGVAAAMTLLFVLAIRELGSSLFLYTTDTMVMAVALLDLYDSGTLGTAAAFGLVQVALLGILIGVAGRLSRGATNSSLG
jgi:iron(III) transport system permease protein